MRRQTQCGTGCTACRESTRVNNERHQKELQQVSNEEITEKPRVQAMAIRAAKKAAKKGRKAVAKKAGRKAAPKKAGRKAAAKGARKTVGRKVGAKKKAGVKKKAAAPKKAGPKKKAGVKKAAAKKGARKTAGRKKKAAAAPMPDMSEDSSGEPMN
jgi:hypothetical protein